MKILVTGGTGLLGWWVTRVLLHEYGHDVISAYHEKKPVGIKDAEWTYLNISDSNLVNSVISRAEPDVVIHAAAFTNVDGCERDKSRAYEINYRGTLNIVRACHSVGCRMIYVSTDYVFDGSRGMYSEKDVPSPINYYGLSKLLGEAVVSALDNSIIVRVSGLYGFSPTGKQNFGLIALRRLANNESVRAFTDQYLSPTYVPHLARALAKVSELNINGVLHIAGERTSRYEFATKLAKILGVDESLVIPTSINEVKLLARRPKDSSLKTSKASSLGITLPPQEKALKDFIKTYFSLLEENW